MKILTTSSSAQTIKIIPRAAVFANVTLKVTDKNTRSTETISMYTVLSDNYLSIIGVFNLKEGSTYSMELIHDESQRVLYRDTIFCTDQTDFNKFDVHKDDYVEEDSFDNEFIIL